MADIGIFEENAKEYDEWFDQHHAVYQSELNAVKKFVGDGINGLDVGIGTGRFAIPLGIRTGIDAAKAMATISQAKGMNVVQGKAELLPYSDERFEFVLMITVICFLEDPLKALKEAYRVTQKGGYLVVGFLEKDGILARTCQKDKDDHPYYRNAKFYSCKEVQQFIKKAGYENLEFRQTIFDLEEGHFHDVKEGCDQGGFVVIRAFKPA